MMMKRYLTEAEQTRLLAAAKNTACPLAQRDYWWMRLMLATGARVNELSLLSAAQAETALATGWLVVLPAQRKGGKRGQEYAVTQSVRASIEALLKIQRQEAAPIGSLEAAPLLWGRDGERLSVRSYQARLKHWVQVAGLDGRVSPHWLRHSRGVNIINRSGAANPLKVAQIALGHASIASTGIYTQMTREAVARDLQRVDGARLSKARAVKQANQQAGGAL